MADLVPRSPRSKISAITDWRVRDENDLPDVAPGHEYERVIAPQRCVALRRIVVRDPMTLVRLEIGTIPNPFELESTHVATAEVQHSVRTYRLGDLGSEDLGRSLLKIGAAIAARKRIAIAPGLEIRVVLRNEGADPAKACVALLHEEVA